MCRRLLPEFPRLAFIAASVCLVWAPGDLSRLSTVECALYAGITFGAMAALAILVESWFNGSRLQLALACVLAFAVVRSYEGTLAVLACAPLLLLATRTERRRLALWCGAWVGFLLASAAFAVAPLVWPPDASYQVSVLKRRWIRASLPAASVGSTSTTLRLSFSALRESSPTSPSALPSSSSPGYLPSPAMLE